MILRELVPYLPLVTLYTQGNQLGRVENFVDENKNKIYDIGESFDDESGNGKRDTDPLSELKRSPDVDKFTLI